MGFINSQCLDEWIGITLPKTVFIQNYRLGMVDMFLKFLVCCYVAFTLLYDDTAISVNYVPEAAIAVFSGDGNFKTSSALQMKSTMCDESQNDRYDYWYGSGGGWTYTNQSCIELGPRERAMKLSIKSLYVPTYVDETFYNYKLANNLPSTNAACDDVKCSAALGKCPHSQKSWAGSHINSDGQCLCTCAKNRHYLATGAEEIQVSFMHLPQWSQGVLPKMESYGLTQPQNLRDLNMITIVRDQNKKEVKRFQPGKDVDMTVAELLQLGGDYKLEDSHRPFTTRNYLFDNAALAMDYRQQVKEYPHMRITGTKVTVHVSYYNAKAKGYLAKDTAPHDICYVDITIVPQWAGMPIEDILTSSPSGENDSRSRYYYGVLISFSVSGAYTFFDWPLFLTYVASAIVYMSVPNMIMVVISKWCLGTLSEIYYKAQCTLLDTWELFSGQTCRAIVGMFAYNKLLQMQPSRTAALCGLPGQTEYFDLIPATGEGSGSEAAAAQGASSGAQRLAAVATTENQENTTGADQQPAKQDSLHWGILREQIMDLFEEQEALDEGEVDTLLRVLLKILDRSGDRSISQQSFVESVVNSDTCSLKNWADLFDTDRKPHIFERLFDTTASKRASFANHGDPHEGHPEKAKKRRNQQSS